MAAHLESAHPEDLSQPDREQDQRPLAVGNTPWGRWTLLFTSIIFGFGAAGTLAALNWRRLGRPGLLVPTLLIAVGGMVAFNLFILARLSLSATQIQAVSLLANAVAASAFWAWQRSAHAWWSQTYRARGRAGAVIPIVVGLAWSVRFLL